MVASASQGLPCACANSRTTRDATSPCWRRSKIWLIADKWLKFDIGLDLAPDGEVQRFGHILTSADERTANGDAVRHHIEKRDREFAWRQPHQHAGATLAGHADALFECAERGRRNQNAMCSAAGFLLHGGCRIARLAH